jgi:hypothetical protein
MMFKNLLALMFALMASVSAVSAKEWRGIVPLKSTRADVERLLGKPNRLGRYDIQKQRVIIWYSEGPCEGRDAQLAKANCECLVAKDTVLRISVTLDSPVKVSKLAINKKKYQRTSVHAYEPTATYSDFTEGVVYTIRESDDTVANVDYLPSAMECEQVVSSKTTAGAANAWQGITPLRSTRAEVEQLLGPAKSSLGDIYKYDTPDNRVDISYAADPCKVNETNAPRSAADVVTRITVSPLKTLLVRNLSFDKRKYTRIQTDHPENWVHYLNSADGITVEAMLNDGCEEVISIVYQPTQRDRDLRCGPKTPKQEAVNSTDVTFGEMSLERRAWNWCLR